MARKGKSTEKIIGFLREAEVREKAVALVEASYVFIARGWGADGCSNYHYYPRYVLGYRCATVP